MSADASEPMDVTSSDDSSDSDFEEVDAIPEEMDLLAQLETDLETNPNLYDSHVQYVQLLRKLKMNSKLRTARQAMQQLYPLTEELWLEWLEDESTAKYVTAVADIEQLFQMAVQDYLSVAVWTAYISFLGQHNQPGDSAGLIHFRDVCEQAVAVAGLHIALGSQLWETYRQFEVQLLASDPASETQLQRVRQLYHRQLLVPLADAEQTMQSYQQWEASHPAALQHKVPQHVQQGFQKAQQAVSIRSEHEAMVAAGKPADENLLAAFLAYIKYEEAKGEVSRVQLIYERALTAFPVTHYMWQAYANYLQDHLKVPAAVSKVYSRAVRNCPWVGSLWANALRALELDSASTDQQHAALYGSALQAGLQTSEDYMEVILARLDALRHKAQPGMQDLRPAFQQAAELMQTYFPDYTDRSLRIHAYWADCELHLAKDPLAAEAVWEGVLKSTASRYVESWVGYVTMLVASGNHEQARRVYKRGYSRKLEEGSQPFLCEAWVRFEREHGTANSLAEAMRKVRPILEQAAAAAAAVADVDATTKAHAAAKKAKKLTPEEMKKLRQQADPTFQAKQAAAADGQAISKSKAKKNKAKADQAQAKNNDAKSDQAVPAAKATAPAAAAEQAGEAGTASATDKSEAAAVSAEHNNAQAAVQAQYDQAVGSKRRQGLGFSADDQPQPKRSKPADDTPAPTPAADAQHAQTDKPLGSQYDPSASQQAANADKGTADATTSQQADAAASQKPAASDAAASKGPPVIFTDECTAFVRGIDAKATEDELQALLAPCGDIKDVRFVIDKFTGRSKGFGYVEFANNSALQKAVELQNPELHGRKLTIMVSKPPSGGAAGRGVGRGRGRPPRGGEGGRANRGRSVHRQERVAVAGSPASAFVPRAVAKKEGSASAGATNDDFRQLLNKK